MKLLIIDKMHDSITTLLSEAGFDFDYKPTISRQEILATVSEYEGMIVRSKTPINAEILASATKLQVIARAGAGLDQLDMETIEQRGIEVVNAPEGNRDALAEHAMALLLGMLNKVVSADSEVRAGIWDREGNRGYELMGKTVGIIGFGYMGQAFARRLQSFGVKVLAYDKYLPEGNPALAQTASMAELFAQTDILSFHVPLTAETAGYYNTAFFEQFAKPIWVLNTARGGILDLEALLAGLNSGQIIGAALDVLENEKINQLSSEQQARFDELKAHKQVLFTPHVGGWTYESYRKINEVLVDKLKSVRAKFL